jgi:hypothetical protein
VSAVGEREAEDAGHRPGDVLSGAEARRARDAQLLSPGVHLHPRREAKAAGARGDQLVEDAGAVRPDDAVWLRLPRRRVRSGRRRPCPQGRAPARRGHTPSHSRAPEGCARGCPAPARRTGSRREERRTPGSSRDRGRPRWPRRRRVPGASARDRRASRGRWPARRGASGLRGYGPAPSPAGSARVRPFPWSRRARLRGTTVGRCPSTGNGERDEAEEWKPPWHRASRANEVTGRK